MSQVEVHSIPELLHDAPLLRGEYDGERRELRLSFACLRRHRDGTKMSDPTVTLHLEGVAEITIAYDTLWPEDRPSAFRLPADAHLACLEPWPLPEMEVELRIDAASAAESLALAASRETLIRSDGAGAAHLVSLHLSLGTPRVPVIVSIQCSSIRPFTDGQPLPIARWAEEFAAWWTGWRDQWRSQDRVPAQGDRGRIEVAPPAWVAPDESSDKPYAPPRQPAFDCPPSDAPEELLAPVHVWFEAGLELDAQRRVAVAPNLDENPDEQVASLQAAMTGDDYGSWDYAREIETWWTEGDRAYVEITGVTHYMPMDGDPADNQFSRWGFALRRRAGVWQIHTHTSTTDDDLETRPWARRWLIR